MEKRYIAVFVLVCALVIGYAAAVSAICPANPDHPSQGFFSLPAGFAGGGFEEGDVDIELGRWVDQDRDTPFEEGCVTVMPGAWGTEIVEVTNAGSTDCWVRVILGAQIADEAVGWRADTLMYVDIDGSAWTEREDGIWYYHRALEPGQTTEPLFTRYHFGTDVSSADVDGADVSIAAQAVQTNDNGSSALDAGGWPEP